MLSRLQAAAVPVLDNLWSDFFQIERAVRQTSAVNRAASDETERLCREVQLSYFLRFMSAAEGHIRLEFSLAKRKRRREPWKSWSATFGKAPRVRLDELLEIWQEKLDGSTAAKLRTALGRYRQLRSARHWLSHGQHWPLKLGSDWDVYEAWRVAIRSLKR